MWTTFFIAFYFLIDGGSKLYMNIFKTNRLISFFSHDVNKCYLPKTQTAHTLNTAAISRSNSNTSLTIECPTNPIQGSFHLRKTIIRSFDRWFRRHRSIVHLHRYGNVLFHIGFIKGSIVFGERQIKSLLYSRFGHIYLHTWLITLPMIYVV